MDNKNELIEQWPVVKPRIERYVFSLVKDGDDTNDIVQEVFVKAFTKIETLKNADKLVQWLFSIARNEANRYFNTTKKQLPTPAGETGESEETPVITNGLEDCISHFIGALPQKYSAAVRLAEIENVPQHELAKKLNISYSGAKSRVQRGREKLKELLTQCCHIAHDKYGNIIEYRPRPGGHCARYCG